MSEVAWLIDCFCEEEEAGDYTQCALSNRERTRMSKFSDKSIESITWEQVQKFGKSHDAFFCDSIGLWDSMSLDKKRRFMERLESVCGVEFRLDTMTPTEVKE